MRGSGLGQSAYYRHAHFVTIAKPIGADDSQAMQQAKYRTMIDRYIRVQQVDRHNTAMKLGL